MRSFVFAGVGALAAVLLAWSSVAASAQGTPPLRPAADPLPGDSLTLTLSEAQRRALRDNPEFLADAREADVARAQLRQARLPAFNPELEVVLPGAATGAGVNEYEASLGLSLEVAGQRGLRSRAARMGVSRADASVRDAGRIRVAEASLAFYAAVAARRRLALADQALTLGDRLFAAVRTQRREGEISVLEANLAEIESGRARARVLGARREASSAELELRRVTGLVDGPPLRLGSDLPAAPLAARLDLAALTADALGRRPDVTAAAAAVQEFRALGTLARREALPNLRLAGVAERDTDGGDTRLGVGVGISLPLLNRNQGRVAERRAQAEQAELRRQALELRVRTQVADAYRSYVTASEEAAVYERDVLQPARENGTLLETAYRAGKIDLPTLLLLRNQLLEAESGYWDTWLARHRAFVDLQSATATLPSEGMFPNDQNDR